jgi:hypothetical protein
MIPQLGLATQFVTLSWLKQDGHTYSNYWHRLTITGNSLTNNATSYHWVKNADL